jgi:DNA mismatch endonuclease (patch repair protein)
MRRILERERAMARNGGKRVQGRAPSYRGLRPRSIGASRAASGASKKVGTSCEVLLQQALVARGLIFEANAASLPGCPDLVFPASHLIVFCDGDFWHGRKLKARLRRLGVGHNGTYWAEKIASNVRRDRRQRRALRALGWKVMRFWECDIVRSPERIAETIERDLDK